ncbi:MAG TPA: HTTM domain-containing protein, partial [Balneolaceae bacterium]|nr:HTTM domain-containing protein [Balneolaceae bacterium]
HNKILSTVSKWFNISKSIFDNGLDYSFPKAWIRKASLITVSAFFVIQLLFPFRYMLYPGELFWTEEGYRFSWRVMLMEKAGYTNFKV